MKYALVALSAYVAYVTAQQVEACDGQAQVCLDDAVDSTGVCEQGDWTCGCANMEVIQGAATSCVIEACGGAAGALAVLEEVQAICANLPDEEDPDEEDPDEEDPDEEDPDEEDPDEEDPDEEDPDEEDPDEETPDEETPEDTTMSTIVTPTPTACMSCDGEDGSDTETGTTPTPTFVEAGAGAVAPVAALAFGIAALAL